MGLFHIGISPFVCPSLRMGLASGQGSGGRLSASESALLSEFLSRSAAHHAGTWPCGSMGTSARYIPPSSSRTICPIWTPSSSFRSSKSRRRSLKKTFFKVPIFSYLLRESGFMPATNGGEDSALMIRNCESIKAYLASGGNVFIFPEGTRSRTGLLGPFNKGAFSIARYCRAPIQCLLIRRTNRLFVPGRFLVQYLCAQYHRGGKDRLLSSRLRGPGLSPFRPDPRNPHPLRGEVEGELRKI